MSEHTPGPWFIEDGRTKKIDHLNVFHVNDKTPGAASGVIAKVTCRVTWYEEQTANAKLIAAAPDLLACLTMGSEVNTPDMLEWVADRLVSVHGESPFVDFVVSLRNRANAMRKAISKAKGEPA